MHTRHCRALLILLLSSTPDGPVHFHVLYQYVLKKRREKKDDRKQKNN